MSAENNKHIETDMTQELVGDFKKAETDLLKEALKRTYAERFFFATTLYKIGQTLSKATITHKQDKLTK